MFFFTISGNIWADVLRKNVCTADTIKLMKLNLSFPLLVSFSVILDYALCGADVQIYNSPKDKRKMV